jgi:putative hemolysin
MRAIPLSVVAMIVVLAGCASASEIVPAGKDSYMVVGQARGGAMMTGKSIIEASKAANAFCAQKGLNMQIRTSDTDGSATWTAETSKLIFSCLREDDPEYKRPAAEGASKH